MLLLESFELFLHESQSFDRFIWVYLRLRLFLISFFIKIILFYLLLFCMFFLLKSSILLILFDLFLLDLLFWLNLRRIFLSLSGATLLSCFRIIWACNLLFWGCCWWWLLLNWSLNFSLSIFYLIVLLYFHLLTANNGKIKEFLK